MAGNEVVSCLFCASDCSIVEASNESLSPPLFQEDSPAVREQLKSFFILRKILYIPIEILVHHMGEKEGNSQPELWAKICGSCGPLVRQFYDSFREISRLEKILVGLDTELKEKIVESKEKMLKGPTVRVMREVRNHVLREQERTANGFFLKNLADNVVQESDDEELGTSKSTKPPRKRKRVYENEEDNEPQNYKPNLKKKRKLNVRPKPLLPSSGRRERESKKEDANGGDREEATAPLKYACSQCPYESSTKQLLLNHLAVHRLKSGQETCDACGWVFAKMGLVSHRQFCKGSRNSLGNTFRRTRVSEPVRHACSQCPYESNHKKMFDRHLTLHQRNEGVETCSGCRVVFSKFGLFAHRQFCKRW